MASQKTRDSFLAYNLHKELNTLGVTENATGLEKENYRPKTLIDNTLELIDPTPNIYTLFQQFNERFFWKVLLPVEVKWSNRMTSCAGTCAFHSKSRQCVITLSAPLLKLRPRKDLVETLLHEMIHGYLFLTRNDRDRDGHGPNFCKHMDRINKEAGTNITIYHNFHEEVKLYQQHWWKCNGPCQYRPPFFGTVRRSMNRAPGPSDYWWHEHRQNCKGQFIKIREPENFKSKQNEKSKTTWKNNKPNMIGDWLTKNSPTNTKSVSTSTYSTVFSPNAKTSTETNNNISKNSSDDRTNLSRTANDKNNSPDLPLGMKKLGNTSNNVHGWSTNDPSKQTNTNVVSKNPRFFGSGTVGGSNSGQSNLLMKFLHTDNKKRTKKLLNKNSSTSPTVVKNSTDKLLSSLDQPKSDSASCPVCNVSIVLENMNVHIDVCITSHKATEKNDTSKCGTKSISIDKLNSNNHRILVPIRPFSTLLTKQADTDMYSNKRLKSDDLSNAKLVSCPVCSKVMPSTDINEHLDICLLKTDTVHKTAVSSNSSASNNDSVIDISSSSFSDFNDSDIETSKPQSSIDINASKNGKINSDHKCLVCNEQISPKVSLNEHLEECIGPVFNEDMTIDEEDDNNTSVTESNSIEHKYPCPVCMQIISKNFMNLHLDKCLKINWFK